MMTSGPWRTPSGAAPVAPFRSSRELVDAVIAHAARAIELAIAQRVRAGEISDRGDSASTYLLDPPRIHTLIHGPAEPAPELERAAGELGRRDQGLLAQLAASQLALATGFARWELADDDRRIALILIAAGLSSRIGRLLAVLGGDPAAAGVTVEAIAALIAPGDAGILRAADRLVDGPLDALGLVQIGRPDLPLPRRPIAAAPRLADLALDRLAVDPSAGAVVVGSAGHGAVTDPVRDAVRAVVHRGRHPLVGALTAEHDGLGALAGALGELSRPLLLAPIAAMIDPSRRAAVIREALLIDAALAIELDLHGGALAGAAIDQLAARIASFLIYPPGAPPPRLTAASVTVPIALPGGAEIDAAIARGFAADPAAAGPVPRHLLAIERAGRAVGRTGAAAPSSIVPAIVDQLLPVAPAGAIRLAGDRPLQRGGEVIDRVVQRWCAPGEPRRLAVLISGVRGLGKARLGAAIAHRMGIQAFQLDKRDVIPASLVEAIDVGAALAVLRDLNEEEIRELRGKSWWAITHGLLVVTTTKRLEPSDTSEFDLQFRIEPPNARERAALWASALASRGATVEPTGLADLARFPLGEHRIAQLVRTAPDLTAAALVAAVQRELGVGDK